MTAPARLPASIAVRLADPATDAQGVTAIYGPSVETGLASFEEVAPSVEEMAIRMRSTLERTPWLVAMDADDLIGYAYAGPHRERAGYRWSVNVSVYVAHGRQGHGVGRALYEALLVLLRQQGFVNAYAGIALPNPASVALHRAVGMEEVGVYRRVGFKFGAWHDVAWYWLRLWEPDGPPAEPIPLPRLIDGRGGPASLVWPGT
jgi:phosphinothricin acetyltransferase